VIEFTPTAAWLLLILALVATVILLRRLELYLPSRWSRRLVQRWVVPAFELLAAANAAGWIFARVIEGRSPSVAFGWAALFLALGWTARSAIEDFVAGSLLRMEGGVERGRRFGAAGVSGRIARMGYRSLEVEADDGSTIRLPWRNVARGAVRFGQGAAPVQAHSFTIAVPRTRPIERVLEEIPAAALGSPWASTTRLPEVRLQAESDQSYVLEVTAHALDARFAPQIEADIRERLGLGTESRSLS
jgi:small-conductance mechanosensitive channel